MKTSEIRNKTRLHKTIANARLLSFGHGDLWPRSVQRIFILILNWLTGISDVSEGHALALCEDVNFKFFSTGSIPLECMVHSIWDGACSSNERFFDVDVQLMYVSHTADCAFNSHVSVACQEQDRSVDALAPKNKMWTLIFSYCVWIHVKVSRCHVTFMNS